MSFEILRRLSKIHVNISFLWITGANSVSFAFKKINIKLKSGQISTGVVLIESQKKITFKQKNISNSHERTGQFDHISERKKADSFGWDPTISILNKKLKYPSVFFFRQEKISLLEIVPTNLYLYKFY